MSNQSKITFTAPFPFCDECKYAEIERNAFYATGNKKIYQTNRCSREPICSNAVARYKELIGPTMPWATTRAEARPETDGIRKTSKRPKHTRNNPTIYIEEKGERQTRLRP